MWRTGERGPTVCCTWGKCKSYTGFIQGVPLYRQSRKLNRWELNQLQRSWPIHSLVKKPATKLKISSKRSWERWMLHEMGQWRLLSQRKVYLTFGSDLNILSWLTLLWNLMPFPSTSNCEAGFSARFGLKTKQRNRIGVDYETETLRFGARYCFTYGTENALWVPPKKKGWEPLI